MITLRSAPPGSMGSVGGDGLQVREKLLGPLRSQYGRDGNAKFFSELVACPGKSRLSTRAL